MVALSQFFGWVEPQVAFTICIFAFWRANPGQFARIFGRFCVLLCVIGGISFLVPTYTYLQKFQGLGLAVYGLFLPGLRRSDTETSRKQGLVTSVIHQ